MSTKSMKETLIDLGADPRFWKKGIIKELPDGGFSVDPKLLAGLPNAESCFDMLTGKALDNFTFRMSRNKKFGDNFLATLKDYDHARFPSVCERCGKLFMTAVALQEHECVQEEAPVPSKDYPQHPSNKNFIMQMQKWGWKNEKVMGDKLRMSLGNETVVVQREHIHDGNLGSTFKRVYDLTTNGDAARFWNDAPGQKASFPQAPAAPAPVPDQKATARGNSNKILVLINERRGGTITVDELVKISGLKRQQVFNSTFYLHKMGAIERIKQGVYKAKPSNLPADYRASVDHPRPVEVSVTPLTPVKPESLVRAQEQHKAPERPAERPTAPDPAPVAPAREPSPRHPSVPPDDMINDVLDLMFPNGMIVTARTISLVEDWKKATCELIAKIRPA